MLRAGLLVLLLAAACGGSSAPATMPDNRGGDPPATPAAVAQWAAVMTPGAVFTFDDYIEDGPVSREEATVVVATVAEVKEVEGGRAAVIDWTVNGEPLDWASLPVVVLVDAAGVTFYTDRDAFEARDPEATRFPASPGTAPGGIYVEPGYAGLEGELCYGVGPEDDAPECEDVCFAHLCVHPTEGITGGEGLWWPNYVGFRRREGE